MREREGERERGAKREKERRETERERERRRGHYTSSRTQKSSWCFKVLKSLVLALTCVTGVTALTSWSLWLIIFGILSLTGDHAGSLTGDQAGSTLSTDFLNKNIKFLSLVKPPTQKSFWVTSIHYIV